MQAALFSRNFTRIFLSSLSPIAPEVLLVSHHILGAMDGWVLECLQHLHDPIPLPDSVPVRIGRSPQTQITEPRCSRLQVEVQVVWKTGEIRVTQLGANTTAVDGYDLQRGKTITISPESTIFILKGQYPHKVVLKGNKSQAGSVQEEKMVSSSPKAVSTKLGTKRSAAVANGMQEEIISFKRQKGFESIAEKEMSSKKNQDEKGGKKSSKAEKKNETKFCSLAKNSSRDEMNCVSSEKTKEHHRNKKNKESSKDKKSTDIFRGSHAKDSSKSEDCNKMDTGDISDEDDDSRVKAVSGMLEQLKKAAKALKSENTDNSGTSKSHSSSSERRKSSTESKGPKDVKPAAESTWTYLEDEKLSIFTAKGVIASEKIAGFDIDGTIITTQSGRVFPKDMTDWKILMPEIFGKLKHLISAGFKIVFFTNQLGVGRGKIKLKDLQDKFEKVVTKLQVPVQIFISTSGGSFRKPSTGMWQLLKKHWNGGIAVSMTYSFYVGDAAGRQDMWAPKKKKDFSCSDRLFAINAGLKFHTPEEFFLGQKPAAYKLPDFDPRTVSSDIPLLEGGENVTSDRQEVVVLVGFQASGKSTFAKTHLVPKGYVYVNQDSLKTWQKCVSECYKALAEGKSVVIDNTNVDPESRARYIDCARKTGKPCRCLFFDFSISHCRHNERFREITNKNHKPINEQIFNSTKSKFKAPKETEGFSKVIRVNFVPNFTDRIHEKIYRQFLLEK